jgi:hypothetical protein
LTPTTATAAPLVVDGALFFSSVAGSMAGSSVARAGDVNGDGFADVVVGAPKASSPAKAPLPARTANGAAYVVFGPFGPHQVVNLDNLGTHGFKVVGGAEQDENNGHLGTAVAGVGDVNGDGRADVALVADRGSDIGSSSEGYAAVVLGSASSAAIDLHNGIGARGFRVTLPASYYKHQYLSVSAAGDVNKDGLADLAIGDPVFYDDAAGPCQDCARGHVYVAFGRHAITDLDGGALGNDGYRVIGRGTRSYLGVGLAPAGDINHDGLSDLVAGEPTCLPGVSPCGGGSAYVLYGKFDTSILDLSKPIAGHGFAVTAPPGSSGLGTSVAVAGDVNRDGRTDLLLGAPYASGNSRTGNGAAYLVFTPANPPAAIDLGTIGASAALVQGAATGDALGSSVSPAGDLDGDGYADFAVGAPHAAAGKGSVYVLRNLHQPALADAATLAPPDGYELRGATARALGTSLADLGDLDGDNRDDLLIGGPAGDPPSSPDAGFAELQFASLLPSVLTGVATAVKSSSATVSTTVVAAGQPATVRIQYGPGNSLGSVTSAKSAGSGAAPAVIPVALSGLAPSTTYSYRAVGSNASGVTYGRVRTLITHAESVAPVARITAPACRGAARCRRVLARRSSWGTLRGPVTDAAPSSGIARVEVLATARRGRGCFLLGTRGFTKARCSTKARWLKATVQGARWRIGLRHLPLGTVRVQARAVDKAHNVQQPAATRRLGLKS